MFTRIITKDTVLKMLNKYEKIIAANKTLHMELKVWLTEDMTHRPDKVQN